MTHHDRTETTFETEVRLSHDERKAAEAAFRGLPLSPAWSKKAQAVYLGIITVTNGRDIVTDSEGDVDVSEREDLAVGV